MILPFIFAYRYRVHPYAFDFTNSTKRAKTYFIMHLKKINLF